MPVDGVVAPSTPLVGLGLGLGGATGVPLKCAVTVIVALPAWYGLPALRGSHHVMVTVSLHSVTSTPPRTAWASSVLVHGVALGYVPLHDGVPKANVLRAESETRTCSPVGRPSSNASDPSIAGATT